MHLSAVHSSSNYSRSADSVAKVSSAPMHNTLISRRDDGVVGPDLNWKLYGIFGAAFVVFILLCFLISHCWFKSRKAKKQSQTQA